MTHETRVICLGNELVRDDGIGIRVGRVLQRLPLPDHITVELRRLVGLELLDELRPDQALLIVDAMRSDAAPGTCLVIHGKSTDGLATLPSCQHGFGLAEALAIARRLHPHRAPRRITIVAIVAEELDHFDTGLTPTLQQALPSAVGTVLETLNVSEELQAKGRAEAALWKSWEPTVDEIAG